MAFELMKNSNSVQMLVDKENKMASLIICPNVQIIFISLNYELG